VRVLVGWPEAPVDPAARIGSTANGAPVSFESGSCWPTAMAANGRLRVVLAGCIYNRAALAATLTALEPGGRLDDAGVVLRLWEERGAALLAALRGAFAVAVWDARVRRLVLARDQLGLVPLYVTGERERLAASVSLPALLALPGVSPAWDAVALDALLTLGAVPPPATAYLAIRQIGPGESLVLEDGRPRLQRWWQLGVPERAAARGDGASAVHERLRESVRLRAGGVRTTLCLSGGLDAVAVLALAAAERRAPPHAVTWSRVRDGELEARLAAGAAVRAGVEHSLVEVEPDWAAALDAVLDLHGMPVPGFDVPYLGAAAQPGWRLLGGHGGEAVLGGSPPHREWVALTQFRALPGPLRELVQLCARLAPGGRMDALVTGTPLAALGCVQRARRRLAPAARADLYTPDALAALGGRGGDDLLGALAADAVAAGADHPLDVIHHVTLQLALQPLAALHLEAAGRGAELRLPLVDHRLAQVALGVPPERRGSAWGRQLLLRIALGRRLPRAVARQASRRLAPAPAAWTCEPLRGLVEDGLAPGHVAAAGVFQPDTVSRLVAEHRAGRADHAEHLWSLIVVSRWLGRAGWPSAASSRATG